MGLLFPASSIGVLERHLGPSELACAFDAQSAAPKEGSASDSFGRVPPCSRAALTHRWDLYIMYQILDTKKREVNAENLILALKKPVYASDILNAFFESFEKGGFYHA